MADPEEAELVVPEPALTVAAVARRLGVAPATLRTWDRRYGLGPSAHTPGAHRRYTAGDLERLQVMRQLTVDGVAPVDAARLALASPARSAEGAAAAPGDAAPASSTRSTPLATVSPLWAGGPGVRTPARTAQQSGGGRVVAMPGGTAEARGLARAALALDSYACSAIIDAALEREGVVRAWETLLVPVLRAVGERWAATGEGVEVEHVLADVVTGSLSRFAAALKRVRNPRPVLLACMPEEMHVLPLHALAAALAERDVGTRLLGARTPSTALRSAVERSGPAAVILWSQSPRSADPQEFAQFPAQRPAPLVVAAGPGWDAARLPAEVALADSLPSALQLVEGALRGLRQ